ncbi:glycosyltransferase [Elioraea sp.]|uniref:glycosyltransferase n=1 Tax=Elioraea sp. TaxID=2185103 RepID=UPI0025B952E3|nr:glycosyltransferase [Elioraea sp.]
MQVLFIHRQGPGQFAHLARRVAAEGPDRAVMIAGAVVDGPPCRMIAAPPSRRPRRETHPYLVATEQAVLNGQATARAVLALARDGFRPDVVLVHPGWGDALFLPELLPRTPIVAYAEYFPRAAGTEIGHDDDLALDEEGRCALVMRQAPLLLALDAATAAIAPTRWQRDLHPAAYRDRIAVVHEGIDTETVRPDRAARLRLADGTILSAVDEVVSYVARDLEPVRGFPALMRALPDLLTARPAAHVVICGGDGVSYGRRPPGGGSWRARLCAEIGPLPPRVHFTGPLPYGDYLALLQVTRLHLHPSAPFVLSWSVTEALAAGAVILGADTAPLREVIRDGVNGFLSDPRDARSYAARAAELLAAHHTLGAVRRAARRTIVLNFGREAALTRQRAVLARAAGKA